MPLAIALSDFKVSLREDGAAPGMPNHGAGVSCAPQTSEPELFLTLQPRPRETADHADAWLPDT